MRIIFTLAGLLFFTLGQAQHSIKVRGSYQDKPLELVLLDLKINHRLTFEFEEDQIQDIRVSASFSRTPLDEAMQILLVGTPLGFEITGERTIRIFERSGEVTAVVAAATHPTRQNITVSGTIRDQASGETLPFASVLVEGTTNGTTTNVDGYFTLFEVPSDTAVLRITYIGYQPLRYRLSPETELEKVEIGLQDFGVQLQEVLVKATQEDQMLSASAGISRIAITPAALNKLPSYGEKDVFRSLQLLPGVSGSNESSSGLYVRGGTPDQNLVLFDGFTVYHVDHLFGFFSAFNANAIKDVQLYKGGFDAKYGGRLSSVVDMTGKDGNTEQMNMGVGLSPLSFNGFVEAPFAKGKGSFLLAVRRSFQSKFYRNIFNAYTDSNSDTASPAGGPGGFGPGGFGRQEVQPNTYFYDLNGKLTYRPSEKDVISVSFYNGQDNLDNSRNVDNNAFQGRFGGNLNFDFQSENTDLTEWGNWGASTKWSRRWNDSFYSNANISYSNYFSRRDRNNSTSIVRQDSTEYRSNGTYEFNDLRDVSFKLDNEWKLSQANQLDFGLQTTWNQIDYEFTQNDTTTLLNRHDEGLTTSLYVQDRHTFNERFILKGGLRSTFYGLTNQLYFEPRASLTYLLSDEWRLKAAWGKYHQFATRIVREDIQQGSRDFWLLADDEQVPISSAFHYILGLSYETGKWLIDMEAYYKTLDGLSEYSTRFTPIGFGPGRELAYEEFFYTGTGIAKGAEFLLQRKVGRFTGWLGYTLGEVKYDFAAFGDTPFPANQDVTHEFKLVGNYKIGRLTLGGTFIYATGRPYTAPTGFYEITLLDGSTADFFEISQKNALRYPNYHRLDLSATYDFRLGSTEASLGLSLFNIYDRKNTWYKEYEVIEGELLETNISLLGFTPSLFFTWSLH